MNSKRNDFAMTIKSKLEQHVAECKECDVKNILCKIGGKLLREGLHELDDRPKGNKQ